MGEEENELEGGIYGGENFLNNVRELILVFVEIQIGKNNVRI